MFLLSSNDTRHALVFTITRNVYSAQKLTVHTKLGACITIQCSNIIIHILIETLLSLRLWFVLCIIGVYQVLGIIFSLSVGTTKD